MNVIPLENEVQLDELIRKSVSNRVLLFKHSTRCIVSKMVWKQFTNEFKVTQEIDLYYLDLLSYRSLSNAVAERFGVVHQSPQLLVIQDGVVVYHASHESIDAKRLATLV